MATRLSTTPEAIGQDVYENSSVQTMPLGAYTETTDGRGFRYVKVGASDLVPGKVYQSPAEDTTNMTLSGGHTPAVAAIGSTTVTLSNAITLAANKLAGGYLSVNVTPGQGQLYKIKSNTAVSAAAGCVITLEDPIRVALTASSRVIFLPSPFDGVVIDPGTATGNAVGVAVCVISAGNYGWLQVKGPCSVLFTGSGVAGKSVGLLTGGTSGSLAPAIAGTQILGWNMGTSITTEYALIYLTMV